MITHPILQGKQYYQCVQHIGKEVHHDDAYYRAASDMGLRYEVAFSDTQDLRE